MKPLILMLLPLVFATTAAAQPDSVESPFETSHRFDRETPQTTYRFTAWADEQIRVRVQTRLSGGRAAWTLTDPNGKRCLNGHLTGSGRGTGDTGVIPGVAGTWELTISHEQADGDYTVTYVASSDEA